VQSSNAFARVKTRRRSRFIELCYERKPSGGRQLLKSRNFFRARTPLIMIKGSLVAVVTPMFEDGRLDFARFKSLIDWHVAEGTDGIVVVGTTGESPTVDFDEHKELIRVAVAHTAGRIKVIAGTGANSTAEAIELTESAKQAGADACLSVAPYYNKPTQEGLYRHYRAIAEAVDIPNILYNVPGRTVVDIVNDTTLRLAQIPNIVGIKDATGNMERGSDLLRRAPRDFAIYSGDDASGLALMLLGCHGVISVTNNVAPRAMSEMCKAVFAGDLKRARELNNKLLLLHQRLFVEANPIPVKWAVEQLGLIESGIRLPLTPLTATHYESIREAMREAGVRSTNGLRLVEGRV
jgi:4-hydroxy-tetrahydrodipicolinate synthase